MLLLSAAVIISDDLNRSKHAVSRATFIIDIVSALIGACMSSFWIRENLVH